MSLSKEDHKKAYELHRQGISKKQIADIIGTSRGTIVRISKKNRCTCGYHDWDELDKQTDNLIRKKTRIKANAIKPKKCDSVAKSVSKDENIPDERRQEMKHILVRSHKKEKKNNTQQKYKKELIENDTLPCQDNETLLEQFVQPAVNKNLDDLALIESLKDFTYLSIQSLFTRDEEGKIVLKIKPKNFRDIGTLAKLIEVIGKEERLIKGTPTEIIENHNSKQELRRYEEIAEDAELQEMLDNIDAE